MAEHTLFLKPNSGGTRAKLTNHDLTGLSFSEHNLSGADFTGSKMYEANLENCCLDDCIFFGCDLRKANFRNSSILRADLRGATLRGAIMSAANLSNADLRAGSFATYDPKKGLKFPEEKEAWAEGPGGVDLRGANMVSVKLSGAVATSSDFEDANLNNAKFSGGNLIGANLAGANLAGADLSECEIRDVNMRGANLMGAMMDFSILVNVDLTGALTDKPAGKSLDELPMPIDDLLALHQLWLDSEGNKGQRLDLSGYDLRGLKSLKNADLAMFYAEHSVWYGQDLSAMKMQASRFKNSDVRNCNFDSADLRGSNFSKSNMVGSKFCNARFEPLQLYRKRMMNTNFSGANLRYTDFKFANLRDANFSNADLSFADFTGADLHRANFANAITEEMKCDLSALHSPPILIKKEIIKD